MGMASRIRACSRPAGRHWLDPASLRAPIEQRFAGQVQQLTQEVQQMRQEQGMPAMVLNRYRNSICYIHGVYQVGFPAHQASLRARLSATGFVVADGFLATNRHVA